MLQRLGWRAVSVPYFEWRQVAAEQRQAYMRHKLEAAGLRLDAAAEGVAGREQEQQQKDEEQQDGSDRLSAEAPPQQAALPAAGSRSEQAEGGGSDSQLAAAAVAERAQRLRMLQYRQGKLSGRGLVARTGSLLVAQKAAAAAAAQGDVDGSGGDDVGDVSAGHGQ